MLFSVYLFISEGVGVVKLIHFIFQRWLTSVDAKPGLNKLMLDMLGRRCHEDHTKYGLVTLILDAMAIKKTVQYNPQTQKMSGFVDMGDGSNETDVASEALVFMVVGIQGHWKAPVAYYLTSALSPETLKVLVVHALEELHARGLRVVCMTMDGHASNISMCNKLGCDLKANPREPLKTSFAHPVTGERVFVMMDACHMLKLARNMLQVNADCCSRLINFFNYYYYFIVCFIYIVMTACDALYFPVCTESP